MIDTNFRTMTINKGTIFKHSSQELANEKGKCERFIKKLFHTEKCLLTNIIEQQRSSLQRLENDLEFLDIMKQKSEFNFNLINDKITDVIKAESLREEKKLKRKESKKKTKNLLSEEEKLIKRLEEIQKEKREAI